MMWMSKPRSPTVVEVEFARSYRVKASTEVWVICLAGTAWLTRDGCLADLILSPGDVTRVSRADAALVTGMPRCRLGIAEQREHLVGLQGMAAAALPVSASTPHTPAAHPVVQRRHHRQ